ncbi:MAG: amidohydrolase family protein [Acidimicrobiia bacterium]|nr:amidohydrolase family protein [Acidimicrobiia bacterium]
MCRCARRRSIPHLSPTDVVDIGTVNGAVALGPGDKVGRVQPGYAADLVLVKFAPFGLSERGPCLARRHEYVVRRCGHRDGGWALHEAAR